MAAVTTHARKRHRPVHRRAGLPPRTWLILVITGLGVALAAGSLVALRTAGTTRCGASALLVPSCGAWWGMYLPVSNDGQLIPAVTGKERFLGRRLDIIERYHDMSASSDGIFPGPAEKQLARNHLLLFSWGPAVWSTSTRYRWSLIASGALDRTVIIPEARRLRAFHHTVFLTFSSEPDGAVPALGTPAEFVAAWRHIHDVFARAGVRNAVWVWTTEGYLPHAATIAALYPGNAYVDWIGYDPYNYYTCHQTRWLSFAQTVEPFYHWLMARHFGGKPFMLAEFSTVPDPLDPGRAAAWYQSIPPVIAALPQIKALIQWDSTVPGCDLTIPSSSAAARGYRQSGLSPYFRKELP